MKKRPAGIRVLTIFIFLYGAMTTWSSIVGIRLFGGGGWLFSNPTAYKIELVILPLAILYIVGSAGLLFLKEWARCLLIVLSALIFLMYILLFLAKGLDVTVGSILFVLTPILFIYIFTRTKAKEQFK